MLFAVVVLHGATIAVSSVEPAADSTTAVLGQACFLMLVLGLVWRYGAKNLRRRERVRVTIAPQQSNFQGPLSAEPRVTP